MPRWPVELITEDAWGPGIYLYDCEATYTYNLVYIHSMGPQAHRGQRGGATEWSCSSERIPIFQHARLHMLGAVTQQGEGSHGGMVSISTQWDLSHLPAHVRCNISFGHRFRSMGPSRL